MKPVLHFNSVIIFQFSPPLLNTCCLRPRKKFETYSILYRIMKWILLVDSALHGQLSKAVLQLFVTHNIFYVSKQDEIGDTYSPPVPMIPDVTNVFAVFIFRHLTCVTYKEG